MKRLLIIAIFLSGLIAVSHAQLMMTGIGQGDQGGVALTGQCPNQLVLDYSNSCALIGQGFGQ